MTLGNICGWEMGVRIQPRDIEVPESNPFENDLLQRRTSIETLTSMVGSIEGPCVLAVDAAWGMGKTTFLNMWAQHLRNQNFPVVKFNAWETDFAENPLIALSTEISDGLEGGGENAQKRIAKLKKYAAKVIRAMPGPLFRIGLSMVPQAGPQIVKGVDEILASVEKKAPSGYQEAKKAITSFRKTLIDTASAVAESREGKPVVVIIDELDRCRPTYAIELLEVAKHLFTVDHIVFVQTIDRAQLAHSIRALYGADFDAEGYLRRYFDVDFRLPDPGKEQFSKAMLNGLQIEGRLQGTILDQQLVHFFNESGLSLRSIGQAIHRLALVLASIPQGQKSEMAAVVALFMVRATDLGLYHRFLRGEATDKEVVEAILARSRVQPVGQRFYWSLFEAVIIAGALQMNHESKLQPKYQRMKSPAPPQDISQAEQRHARRVLDIVEEWESPVKYLEFDRVVKRLELILSD